MTTLADINQTLTVQNEMQEKTTKAIESLSKRLAGFSRVAKGDKLETLEQRREANRQARQGGGVLGGVARGARGFATTARENSGLIAKVIGGIGLAALIMQSPQMRELVGTLYQGAKEALLDFVTSDEFKNVLSTIIREISSIGKELLGVFMGLDLGAPGTDLGGILQKTGLGIAGLQFSGILDAIGNLGIALVGIVASLGPFGRLVKFLGRISEGLLTGIPQGLQRTGGQVPKGAGAPTQVKTPSFLEKIKNAGKGIKMPKIPGAGFIAGRGGSGIMTALGMGTGVVGGAFAALPGLLFPSVAHAPGLSEEDFTSYVQTEEERLKISMDMLRNQEKYSKAQLDLAADFVEKTGELETELLDLIEEARKKPGLPGTNPQPNFYLDRIVRIGAQDGRNYIPPSESSLDYAEQMQEHLRFQEARRMGIPFTPAEEAAIKTEEQQEPAFTPILNARKMFLDGLKTLAPDAMEKAKILPVPIPGPSVGGDGSGGSNVVVPNVANAGEPYHKGLGLTGESVLYGLSRILPLN